MKRARKMFACTLIMMGISIIGTPVNFVQDVISIEANATEARAYIYEWAYKVIDGHVYKRLYNASLGEWVGDWILVE